MIQTEFKTIVVTAEPGMVLTQSADVELEDRILASQVAVGKGGSPQDWMEISQQEADKIKADQMAMNGPEQEDGCAVDDGGEADCRE